MTNIYTKNFVRISKTTARRLYKTNQLHLLYVIPCNLNPEAPWGLLHWIGSDIDDFDKFVSRATHYNCINSETGRYIAYYVPRSWWDLVQAANREFSPDGAAHIALANWEAANR